MLSSPSIKKIKIKIRWGITFLNILVDLVFGEYLVVTQSE